ncbi:hypothetical protein V8E36_006109 [Tilletia maclaganii]
MAAKLNLVQLLSLAIAAASFTQSQPTGSLDPRANGVVDGIATWFTLDNQQVACGGWHSDEEFLIATPFWRREHCGRMVKISSRGVVRYAKAVDSCPSCGRNQLDMTTALFQQFADLDKGVIDIQWHFVA